MLLARQIAIGLGIALIFPLLIYNGVSTFHPRPKQQPELSASQLTPNLTADDKERILRPTATTANSL
jgi:hypothetical protein